MPNGIAYGNTSKLNSTIEKPKIIFKNRIMEMASIPTTDIFFNLKLYDVINPVINNEIMIDVSPIINAERFAIEKQIIMRYNATFREIFPDTNGRLGLSTESIL